MCYSNVPLNISVPAINGSETLTTGLVLPDGTTWRFDYGGGWADLVAVYPPTGGYIKYSWETINKYNIPYGYGYLRVRHPTRGQRWCE